MTRPKLCLPLSLQFQMRRTPKPFSPSLLLSRFFSSTRYLKPPKALIPRPSATNPDADSICSLLSEPSDRPRDLDDLLRDFKPRLNSTLILDTLKSYRLLGRTKTLEFFSWAGLRLGFRLDDPLVEYMADFLGRRKLFDDLKCLLTTVSSHNGRVPARAVAICIRFLGRQGRVAEALALFETMEVELNCRPDNLVVNNVLYVLCKRDLSSRSVDVALAIFSRMGRPDVYSYSNIIVGLCRFGRMQNALEVFDEMGRANLAPTRTAANVLIGKLCGTGGTQELIRKVRVESSFRPFDILVPNLGVKSSVETALKVFWMVTNFSLVPSAHVVKGLILELCRVGEIEEAIEVLKLVESRKVRSVNESYAIVIKALCETRRTESVDQAHYLFGRMAFQGFKPKLVVYNSMIRVLCRLGFVDEAQKYYELMNKNRCEPDCATYIMLIHGHCRVDNWERAYGLLMEMIEFGWCPHLDTFNLVHSLLSKNGRADLSLKLERKMEIQNLYAHCREGRLESAYNRLSSMLAKGFYPPVYVRDAFEHAFQRSGKWNIARDLLKEMDQYVIQNNACKRTHQLFKVRSCQLLVTKVDGNNLDHHP